MSKLNKLKMFYRVDIDKNCLIIGNSKIKEFLKIYLIYRYIKINLTIISSFWLKILNFIQIWFLISLKLNRSKNKKSISYIKDRI